MKKTVVLAIILLVLAIALCGCQDTETTAPTTTKSSVQSVPPTDRGKIYNFNSYEDLQSAISGERSQAFRQTAEREAPGLVPMLSKLSQDITIPKPTLNGELMKLLGEESVLLLEKERHKAPIIWYHCEYKGIHVRVRVSYIDLFDIEPTDNKLNIASFTQMLNPQYPSPDNYQSIAWSEMVVDKTMVIGDKTVFVRAITGANDYYDRIDYLYNDLYISIEAPDLLKFDEAFFEGFSIN